MCTHKNPQALTHTDRQTAQLERETHTHTHTYITTFNKNSRFHSESFLFDYQVLDMPEVCVCVCVCLFVCVFVCVCVCVCLSLCAEEAMRAAASVDVSKVDESRACVNRKGARS